MMAPLSTESAAGVTFSSQSTVKPHGGMAGMRAARHCERSEAIQSFRARGFWIASLRSQ
jgi:hypothetical protein